MLVSLHWGNASWVSTLEITDASTPYDSAFKLTENTGRALAHLEYASGVGSLMYTMHCTRPYIYIYIYILQFSNYLDILTILIQNIVKQLVESLGTLKK
jgi:hypothetical protein